jgi:hypothetical protein
MDQNALFVKGKLTVCFCVVLLNYVTFALSDYSTMGEHLKKKYTFK